MKCVEDAINPDTGNTVNILHTEHECWAMDFDKRIVENG